MTIKELINKLNQIPKEHLDYEVLLETGVDTGDNQWLQSVSLHKKGSSGYELDGALILESEVECLSCEKCGISSREVSLISEADICYQCEKEESEVE